MSAQGPYAGHAVFVAPARTHAQVWRLALGILLAASAYFTLSLLYFQVIAALSHSFLPGLARDLRRGETPLAMYLMLGSFGFMSLGVWLSLRLLHRRGFLSVLGPMPLFLADFRAVALGVVAVTAVVVVLPPWDMGGPFVPNMPLGQWLLLLLPSLAFVLIQTSAEEIVFRGYLQQQLAARFRSPLVWMLLPSALFAAGHYMPATAGENALLLVLWAGVFGLLMADLTARSGSLGPAIAIHFLNNVSAIVFVSMPGDLSGLALYHAPFSMQDAAALRAWMPVDFAMMVVLWLVARVAIRR